MMLIMMVMVVVMKVMEMVMMVLMVVMVVMVMAVMTVVVMMMMMMIAMARLWHDALRQRSCCCSCRNGLVRGAKLSCWPSVFSILESFPPELKTRMIHKGRCVGEQIEEGPAQAILAQWTHAPPPSEDAQPLHR